MRGRKILGGVGATVAAAALGFLALNAIDYFRFRSAIDRAEHLSPAEYRAMGDYCMHETQHRKLAAQDLPPVFSPLRALNGDFFPGSSDLLLYQLGEAYLYLRISTAPENQEIVTFTNSFGPQKTRVLWDRNPDYIREISPVGRQVTLTEWGLHGGRTWIVLSDRILVIDENAFVGHDRVVVASAALDPGEQRLITEALQAIPESAHGKVYRAASVMDGIKLDLHFTPTGEAGPGDITMSNARVAAVSPLLAAISKVLPREYALDFDDAVSRGPAAGAHTTVRTTEEWERIYWGQPKIPWWCVWREVGRRVAGR
jgi:hypothetical protein